MVADDHIAGTKEFLMEPLKLSLMELIGVGSQATRTIDGWGEE